MTGRGAERYIASLARKRMAAGALFRDEDGRVLLVDPAYKPTWDGVQQAVEIAASLGQSRGGGETGRADEQGQVCCCGVGAVGRKP